MAKIKSYTDIEQSRKLAEILPNESADMCYERREFTSDIPSTVEYNPIPFFKSDAVLFKAISCWSLAALLDVLPKGTNISTSDSFNKIMYSCWNGYGITYADNPVDACYEMVLKLNELNLR